MANINDIAKLAGVSVSTVSRVLNNYKYVASDKREAVLKVIEEMNYTPNKNAIDLIRGETRTIGVILPYNNNPAFDQILNGILNKALENDFLITVLPSNYSKEKEVEYLQKLKSKLYDGIIIASRANDWETIIPFSEYGTIVACEYTQHKEIGCSYMDRYSSYLDAFQLLKNKGHYKVAFTTARLKSNSTNQMIEAYTEIFGELQPKYHISDCHSLEDGYMAAKKFLQLSKRPTAIYANGDEVAGGMFLFAKSQQLKIPSDLAIIGQENQPIGIGMGISTVDHQLMKVGAQACDLVINKSTEKVKIPYRIVERDSV
ncbi:MULTISPECIES: LacI family DNA-binding transcriptional regulator [unclassified Bacillus (in: firmicutes)]|uniref:LacI family DNA-binding transcriptional regulator n=1 Tax=unclassified Bacillus (in: firmicutes) TaxID=185979 RepID=UPI000BF168B0|nr:MULTISPECIES: LacI family DNA-binding transcriptional regulator [unclassified Bacillus (in: firmicutes)]PEJ48486.1 LacI family transcriptional regulator [Bacillus sp. AFS002410]PEK99855.1 LacI family transcriptional regulator [Bacillus sp. AFS017336]